MGGGGAEPVGRESLNLERGRLLVGLSHFLAPQKGCPLLRLEHRELLDESNAKVIIAGVSLLWDYLDLNLLGLCVDVNGLLCISNFLISGQPRLAELR